MSLQDRLAKELLRAHSERAASALERLDTEDAALVLAGASGRELAAVLKRLSPHLAADLLERLGVEQVAEAFEALQLDVASRLARRLGEQRLAAVVERLPARRARAVQSLLSFPENTAGALMDPEVLALPEDLSAKEAVARVRKTPEHARYNLYVLDHAQALVGVVNLRELFLARPEAHLSDFMVRGPQRLDARADRSAVLSHPGWKEVHSLPVVDEKGCYLGAVRYRTLRQLEDVLIRGKAEDGSAPEALGQLFAAGAAGLLDALTMPANPRRKGR